ncbi:hypothetical protein AAT19DRAFT_8378 [Rhodotorula toruloides]|uniref:Uncharacterized protein n=1 Tax=Rhodotorula toruloides TaxID=5286 RepID=A0A2T0AH58_RHOTO|nr:hypothetical protein AAT19DRAFT_8378 [Rhodotorula toruloides]
MQLALLGFGASRLEPVIAMGQLTRGLARPDLKLWLRPVLVGEPAAAGDATVEVFQGALTARHYALPALVGRIVAVHDPGGHVAVDAFERGDVLPQEVMRNLLALLQHPKQLLKRLENEAANRTNMRRLMPHLLLDVRSQLRIHGPDKPLLHPPIPLAHLLHPLRQVEEQITKPCRVLRTEGMRGVELVGQSRAESQDRCRHTLKHDSLAFDGGGRREGRKLVGRKVRDSVERRCGETGLAKESVVLLVID